MKRAWGALTPGLLHRLSAEVVVVGSRTSQRRDRIASSDSDIGRAARIALAQAIVIPLGSELTNSEREEAASKYPNERFEHSIGEPLVAADQLTARFEAGRTDNPTGHASVKAAIDWRRAGLIRPISDSELRALYPKYLLSVRPGLEPSDELYQDGLAWACKPLVSHLALLAKVTEGTEHGFVAFNYLVAYSDGQHGFRRRDVLPAMWSFVVDSLPGEEALEASLTAYLRDERGAAEHIWRTLIDRSSDQAPTAAFYLGVLLAEQGDIEGARAAYQQAIDSNHPGQAPAAAVNLGVLLKEQGDVQGARAAYQQAIDSNHPEVVPIAKELLRRLRE
ncbi:MAG: tetratricopeptide repeat protein [Rubrobacter sp.]|nr:tetratricopeptide repeat protein [Rubrobacter sp.]